jgi:GNAT superfamily N-acetyltransferase
MQYQHEVGSPGLILRPLEPGDLGWVVHRHGLCYATEYGWDVTFEGLVARIVAGFAERGDDQREGAWIAEIDGERVGCVFCAAADAISTAQLRLLLVEPSARGAGVGARLVNECVGFAARSGYTRIMLWTQDVQLEARRLYQRAGFKLDRNEPHHSFGCDLVGEYWSRDLHSS